MPEVTNPTRHIPSLDGLRAISFLLVFVAHAGLGGMVPDGLGVTMYFFLSAFLITTLMRIEHERSGRVSFRNFWLRRALRGSPTLPSNSPARGFVGSCIVISTGVL